jgi:hypothetical protein
MTVTKQRGTTIFRCDTPHCSEWHVEYHGASWDEVRMASTKATEAGWHISKRRGRLEALCPECAVPVGYTLGPEGLP